MQRPYEPILQKLAFNLVTLEKESEYLFNRESKVGESLYYIITLTELGGNSRFTASCLYRSPFRGKSYISDQRE